MKKKMVVLTGAGMSAESGLATFRGADGLWNGYRVEDVATPEAWHRNRELVLDFYNQRRRQLLKAKPNAAHFLLVDLERHFEVTIVTQNVDDLHERAGSSSVLHLHGELLKVRSTFNPLSVYEWDKDLNTGDVCAEGGQLRPHIVWFGEAVPNMELAAAITAEADLLVVIGTSLLVYPAAGLIHQVNSNVSIYYIDPSPSETIRDLPTTQVIVISQPASIGLTQLISDLKIE